MAFAPSPGRTRIGAALAAAAVELGLAALVIWGLATRFTTPGERAPTLITITPTVQPTPTPSPARAEAQEAPANGAGEALPVAAARPPLVLNAPRPANTHPAATRAAEGSDTGSGSAQAGADNGAGSGAGGSGTGSGSGTGNSPVRIAGALGDRDYPREAARRRAGGTVAISFRVRGDGSVDRCSVIASSGEPLLDDLTCELVERRFRYRPAHGADGQAVETMLRTSFTWGTRRRD